MIWVVHPGSRIPDPEADFLPSRIPDPGVKKAPNPGSRIRNTAVQYARTDIRKHSFAVRVVEKWNHLPDSVKIAPNKESFKRGLNQAGSSISSRLQGI
jgi:hypothetical protein